MQERSARSLRPPAPAGARPSLASSRSARRSSSFPSAPSSPSGRRRASTPISGRARSRRSGGGTRSSATRRAGCRSSGGISTMSSRCAARTPGRSGWSARAASSSTATTTAGTGRGSSWCGPRRRQQGTAAAAWLRGLAPSDPLAALTLLAMVPSRGPTKGPQFPQGSANAPPRPPQQQAPLPAPAPRLPLAELARSTLWSVDFVDDRYGWVAGDGGALFATTDGGESWERRDAAVPVVLDLREVSFTDRREVCWWAARAIVLETADGGRTWACSTSIAP